MRLTVTDVRDLTQVLTLHPEWLGEVRRLVLTAELLALPDLVRELAEAQEQSEQRLGRLEATVQALAEAQARTEARLESLTVHVESLTVHVESLTVRVESLTVRVESLTSSVEDLVKSQKQIVDTMGGMKGRLLEITYRERVVAYFGRMLRRPHVVSINDLWETLENRLSKFELDDLLELDLLVQGRPRERPELGDVWLAVEVSSVVDKGDVERAQRRAALLCKAGYRAAPLVAGEAQTQGATGLIETAPIVVMVDGQSEGWEAALAALA